MGWNVDTFIIISNWNWNYTFRTKYAIGSFIIYFKKSNMIPSLHLDSYMAALRNANCCISFEPTVKSLIQDVP